MKGDFSWFDYRPGDNFTGVLEQQGRVRLDRDGNDADQIARALRSLMGRDAFGPGRVAVPSEANGSLRITAAETDGTSFKVTLRPGRAWIDGIPLVLGDADPLVEPATHLPPPFQPTPGAVVAGTRDLVVLEVWEDAVNGFQEPDALIEPALGGVDTTERVRAFHRLRLLRLSEDEDCATVGPRLRDDPAGIGRLTVTAAPALGILGDCPVEASGGYTGDGHRLYCVEIAPGVASGPRFTFSRFGGGLVGRGMFDAVAGEVTITANAAMINAAGLPGFHLQALRPDDSGVWQVVFEAAASLVEDGVLAVTGATGTWPAPAGQTAFFRLWDGVRDVAAFAGPTDLADGIRLDFTPPLPDGSNYRPGDRWLFPVRAAGTGFDPALWPANAPPTAIRYHRAPLGILTWPAAPPAAADPIDDCRDSFPPLTDPCPCCTITVGDGVSSHGDENSIEAAIARLPSTGGKICLLPGTHQTNAVIAERANIRIVGCDRDTRVVPRAGARDAAVFTVVDSEGVSLSHMEIISISGVAVQAFETADGLLRQLSILDNRVLACVRAIQVEGGTETVIRGNRIRMLDRSGAGVAVFLTGEDSRIEDNDIGVVPAASTPRPPRDPNDPTEDPDDPNDPCADADAIFANPGFLIAFVQFVFGFTLTAILPPPFRALGGIQIGAGSERIAILDNRIVGGAGNGVTLGGGARPPEDGGATSPGFVDVALSGPALAMRGVATGPDDGPAGGVTLRVTAPSGAARTAVTAASGDFAVEGTGESGAHRFETDDPTLGVASVAITDRINLGAGTIYILAVTLARIQSRPDAGFAFLYATRIEDNEISGMGLNGIGIPPRPGVLPEPTHPTATPGGLLQTGAFVRARAAAANPILAALGNPLIDLTILNNRITGNLVTPFTTAMTEAAAGLGFGGIALGLCETVTIAGNRIEGNGRRHLDPVCGVFILLGEQVEITGNLIRDNGPLIPGDGAPSLGQRGGVAGIFLSVGLDDDTGDAKIVLPIAGKPALRLHGNTIQQPMGRALTALAAGPVAIQDNFLGAERTPEAPLDRMAGAVLVMSFSGLGRLPGGGCLVTGNQIRLGHASTAFVATTLAATEDIGFEANTTEAFQQGLKVGGLALMLNTLIVAGTARATGNRLRERLLNDGEALQVSLLSRTQLMNTTTTNQADHCIFATDQSTPPRLLNAGNLILDAARCQRLTGVEGGAVAVPVFGLHNLAGAIARPAPPPEGDARVFAAPLEASVIELGGFGEARLAQAATIKATSRALVANELARLDAKGNVRADLLAGAEARLARATLMTDRLGAAGQIVASRPAAAAEGALIIQGRILDADGRGLAGRELRLADTRGRPFDGPDPAVSDARGGYVLRLDKAEIGALAETLRKGATVVAGAERSPRFAVTEDVTIAPDLVLKSERRQDAPLTRPERPEPAPQPLERPELTAAARPRAASGRVASLILRATPNPRKPG